MKFFNTAGPVVPQDHYNIPAAQRIDIDEIMTLIHQKKYFVLHAPRQTGKTSALLALMKILNESGKYKCLYVNVEDAQTARGNVAEAIKSILNSLDISEKFYLKENTISSLIKENSETSPHSQLNAVLAGWTMAASLPTILFIDEIDALVGDSLVSVLRQLRSGYNRRPSGFPQSVIHRHQVDALGVQPGAGIPEQARRRIGEPVTGNSRLAA